MKIACWDFETTSSDVLTAEVLQASIIDENGNPILNEYYKPRDVEDWPGAARINNITPEMVKDKPCFYDKWEDVYNILMAADIVVGYNSKRYDQKVLERYAGRKLFELTKKHIDIMPEFQEKFSLYKNVKFKLTDICDTTGIVIKNAHNSLGDTEATLAVYNMMVKNMKKPKLEEILIMSDGKEIYSRYLADKYAKKTKTKIVDKYYVCNGKVLKPNDIDDLDKYWIDFTYINKRKEKEAKV